MNKIYKSLGLSDKERIIKIIEDEERVGVGDGLVWSRLLKVSHFNVSR